nr:hypothetical protein [Tanacetum cinerariifolium]
MALTFVDTHNMIAYLTISDASEGFNQIIDFLNASSIKYALTVNPNIYVSCIKQFWTSVSVKKVNDVLRLQALVDKKKVIITEATFRDALRLADADGINCLPNEEIFTELARMGYEKPSTKLTFYKAFFLPQWKGQVGDLSSHTTKYSSLALTQKVFANMRRVGKGFSIVDTPLFEGMLVAQQVDESAAELNVDDVLAVGVADEGAAKVNVDAIHAAVDEPSIPSPTSPTQPPRPSQDQPFTSQDAAISIDLLQTLLDTCTTLTRRVDNLEHDKIAQDLEITKLKQRAKKLERRNKLKVSKLRRLKKIRTSQRVETSDDTIIDDVSKHGRMIADMDADVDVTLKDIAKDVAVDAEIEESVDVQERQAESQAQIYQINLEHADNVLSMQDDKVEPTELQEVVEVVTTAKLMTEVVTVRSATITVADLQLTTVVVPILTTAPSAARRRKRVVIRDPKEVATPSTIIHDEAKSKDKRKGIFKTKEHMEEKDNKALKRISGSQEDKADKKQKLDEEVPVVDYEIYIENNKPYYMIIRADRSPQLFLSFLNLLRDFDQEDLEVLWELVKERFASSKPKNFSDDFLLTTITYMFEKPDVQAQVWKNQRTVHGLAK